MTSFEQLTRAADSVALTADARLTLTAGFLGAADEGKAVRTVALLGELTGTLSIPPLVLAEALADVIDRTGQGGAFAEYLVAVVSAVAVANAPTTPPPAVPTAAFTLSAQDRATVDGYLATTAGVEGLPYGEALFARSVVVGDLTVCLDVINAEDGGRVDIYVRRGRLNMLAAVPPAKTLAESYRLQVEAKPFLITVS